MSSGKKSKEKKSNLKKEDKQKNKKKNNLFSFILFLIFVFIVILNLIYIFLFYTFPEKIEDKILPIKLSLLKKIKYDIVSESLYSVSDLNDNLYIVCKGLYSGYRIIKKNKFRDNFSIFSFNKDLYSKLVPLNNYNYLVYKIKDNIYIQPFNSNNNLQIDKGDYAFSTSIFNKEFLLYTSTNGNIYLYNILTMNSSSLKISGKLAQWIGKNSFAYLTKNKLYFYDLKRKSKILKFDNIFYFSISPLYNYLILVKRIDNSYKLLLYKIKENKLIDISLICKDFKYIKWSKDERFIYVNLDNKILYSNRDGKHFEILKKGKDIFLSYVDDNYNVFYFFKIDKKYKSFCLNRKKCLNLIFYKVLK